MTPTATTTEPTLEEQVQGLKATAARLAAENADLLKTNHQLQAERDVAFEMASQATKDQEKQRREFLARIRVRDVQIDSLRAGIDGKNVEIRQLTTRIRELALVNEEQQRQLDAAQQKPAPAPQTRRRFRIGARP